LLNKQLLKHCGDELESQRDRTESQRDMTESQRDRTESQRDRTESQRDRAESQRDGTKRVVGKNSCSWKAPPCVMTGNKSERIARANEGTH
jgi:hypothetical protein